MDSFGARLRHERERRRIPLRSIAERTKISLGLLEGLERDDVSRWPSGIFRKSFVRAYAAAIGLDGDAVLREFVELYPDPKIGDIAVAPSLEIAPKPPSQFAVRCTVAWTGTPFAGFLDRLRKRMPGVRLPGTSSVDNETRGYKDAIAAIMKVEP